MRIPCKLLYPIQASAALAGFLCVVTGAFGQDAETQWRAWTPRHGQQTIEGAFVDYDYATQIVTLKNPQGRVIEIPVKSLNASDRQFVLKQLRKRRPESPRIVPRRSATRTAQRNEGPAESIPKTRGDRVPLYGILWKTPMADALADAQGEYDSTDDDRPVMWFRVLGDLAGFM